MRISVLASLMLTSVAAAACSPQPAEKTPAPGPVAAEMAPAPANTAPSGAYVIDQDHTSIVFRVNHMGLSNYTARFTEVKADLQFDPAKPEAMSVTAVISPRSLRTDNSDTTADFDGVLAGPQWLDAVKFPEITFKSTKVEPNGANTAKVTGDFTLRGVTKPVALDVVFNGGMAPNAMDPKGSRIGFSAKTILKRSDYGISYGIPAPGTKMGVGDEIEVTIETEFTQLPSASAITPSALNVPKPKG